MNTHEFKESMKETLGEMVALLRYANEATDNLFVMAIAIPIVIAIITMSSRTFTVVEAFLVGVFVYVVSYLGWHAVKSIAGHLANGDGG